MRLSHDAVEKGQLSQEDADALYQTIDQDRHQGTKVRAALAHAIDINFFTETEAEELKSLLDYRNDIAHRMHLVMADVSPIYWVIDHVKFHEPTYKGQALDRLRLYTKSLWERARGKLTLSLSMDGVLFEFAEQVFEHDLKRLDEKIRKQLKKEEQRLELINAELDLQGTELIDDLSPRFPANHRPSYSYGDDYIPATGHLTERGAEICYRLFDLGKSPIAVAYLMGMTLRSAERRKKSWKMAGGKERPKQEIERYDLKMPQ